MPSNVRNPGENCGLAVNEPATGQPRVWVVLADKAGDNAQVETVVPVLPWPYERKYVHMREEWAVAKPRVEPTLHHIDLSRSDPLEPPWPDLIITIGRRPSMVALWLRAQSGGSTKIALVGKPSGPLAWFDLIIVSAEVQLPPLPNVLSITLPLMQVDEAAVQAAAETWRPRLNTLPRPLVAILVGGPTGPFVYDDAVTDRIVGIARDVVSGEGGTPYITTSRRTPPRVVEALRAKLPRGAQLFAWTPDATENPYRGLLGLADRFVVTGDSISMMVEVARLHLPLAVLDLPTSRLGALDQWRRSLASWLFAPAGGAPGDGLRRATAIVLYRLRLLTQTRDFRGFHRLLEDKGLAVQVGDGPVPPISGIPDDLDRVVNRIRALWAERA